MRVETLVAVDCSNPIGPTEKEVARCSMYLAAKLREHVPEPTARRCIIVEHGDTTFALLVVLFHKTHVWTARGSLCVSPHNRHHLLMVVDRKEISHGAGSLFEFFDFAILFDIIRDLHRTVVLCRQQEPHAAQVALSTYYIFILRFPVYFFGFNSFTPIVLG